MEEKQLYLKRIEDGYEVEFDFQPFDVNLMSDEYFLFKEAAIVVLYPNDTMEAMRSGGGFHHNYYYMKLYEKSKKFKEDVDSLGFPMHFEPDESTYSLDCLLSSLGISSLHNVDIPNIPSRLEYLYRFEPIFYNFKAEQTTDKVEENFGIVYDNYPSGKINFLVRLEDLKEKIKKMKREYYIKIKKYIKLRRNSLKKIVLFMTKDALNEGKEKYYGLI